MGQHPSQAAKRETSKSISKAKGLEKKSSVLLTTKSERIVYKKIRKELERKRSSQINRVRDQVYSLTEEYGGFTEHRGGVSKLDLCVLANKATRKTLLKKACQDDATVIKIDDDTYVFGVFDGHGPKGERISQVCSSLLEKLLSDEDFVTKFLANPDTTLKETIAYLHKTVKDNRNLSPRYSGTTATLALLQGNVVHLSWVGDSKAVLFTCFDDKFTQIKAVDLTTDHNFQTKEEIERIESKGGVVSRYVSGAGAVHGPMRVWSQNDVSKPGLAMSKSIGDLFAHEIGCSEDADYVRYDLDKLLRRNFGAPGVRLSRKAPMHEAKVPGTEEPGSTTVEGQRQSVKSKSGKRPTASSKEKEDRNNSFQAEDGSERKESLNASNPQSPTSVAPAELRIKHCILIIASDGVWNVMDRNEVASFLSHEIPKLYEKLDEAPSKGELPSADVSAEEFNLSARLCIEAQKRWLQLLSEISGNTDDITAITSIIV